MDEQSKLVCISNVEEAQWKDGYYPILDQKDISPDEGTFW